RSSRRRSTSVTRPIRAGCGGRARARFWPGIRSASCATRWPACCRRIASAGAWRPSSRSTRVPTIRTRRRSRCRSPRAGEKPMSPERVSVIWATGKRKSSVARIRLQPGAGEIVVNARPLDAYFGRETSRMIVHQPFEVTSTAGQYRTEVSVRGGGVSAQAVAIRALATRVPVAVLGATGYTGVELLRLLARHPAVELAFLSSEQYRDRSAADVYPFLTGIVETALRAPEPAEAAAAAEIVFTA